MRRQLKTTTALVAGLSLIVPFPVMAQQAPADGQTGVICADGSPLPCPEGVATIAAPDAAATPDAVAPDAATTADQPAAEPAAPADQPAADQAVTEQPADQPAADQATTEQPAADQSAEPVVVQPAPEPAAEPAAEPAPANEPATAQSAAPAAEQPATEPAPAEQPATADTTAEPAPAQPAATEPAATEPQPAEPATAEAAPATAEPAPAPTADDLQKALTEQAQGTAAPDATATPTPAEVPPLPVQPDAASGDAPVAAAAAAIGAAAASDTAATPAPATAPAPAGAVAQVTEETVTKETARSSSEDFANKVNQAAAPAPAQAAPVVVEKKKGLSDTEKLLLLGAGALAVGAIISNNRKVEMNSGDRVIVSRDGQYQVIKDDDALLRQPGARVRTETFNDGSTRQTVLREDGSRIVTIRDAEMRVLRRTHVAPDGRETMLIDDMRRFEPVDVARLPRPAPQPELRADADEAALRAALAHEAAVGRHFSLAQVRDIYQVRALVPVIDLDTITFDTGSSAINPDQARALSRLGKLIQSYVRENPREIFLIEGHTDAVGGAAYNLALSDRRAESVALALTEYFAVPPENLVVQGYGERFLKVESQGDERANRRASVRRITDLLDG